MVPPHGPVDAPTLVRAGPRSIRRAAGAPVATACAHGRTALRISTLVAVLGLVAIALVASRRTHSGWFGTMVFMALATAMGLVIVAIEVYVHHL